MFKSLIKIKELLDKRTKKQFGLLFIAILIKSFLDSFGLGMIGPYVAAISNSAIIFNNKYFIMMNEYLNIQNNKELIFYMSTFMICFFILKNLFTIFVVYFQSRLIFSKRSKQGRALFEAYMKAPYSYHLNHNSSELDRNIRFESTHVYGFIERFFVLFSNTIFTIFVFLVLLIANWQAVISMGIFIIIFSSIFLFFTRDYSKKLGKNVQESQLDIGQSLNEGLSSIIEAKLHKIENFFPDKYFKYMMVNAKANWRQTTMTATPALFFEIIAVGTLVSVIIFLSINDTDINSALPIIGLFSFAFIRLIPTVTAAIKSIQDIKFLIPAVDVIHSDFNNLNQLNKDVYLKNINNEEINFKSLELKNVSFAFKNDKNNSNVINNISFTIKKGEAIGINGPSGSGKTTLINMILGLLEPSSGELFINEVDIKKNMNNWRSMVGYVPQSITLIDASIKNNVALGLNENEIDDEKVLSVLKEANLDELVNDFPEGLNTFIGENGVRLSGGQRQRLGIARALYRNAKFMIFDEATSALDTETEKKITSEIMKLSGNRTLVIIAHRISTIKDCDTIHYLKSGEIMNSGNFEELMILNQDFKNATMEVIN